MKKKQVKNKRWLLLVLLLLVAVGSGFFLLRKQTPEAVIAAGDLPAAGKNVKAMTSEELDKLLQQKADANYISIEVNPKIQGKAGEKAVTLQIINPKKNVFPISVKVVDDASGQTILTTGSILPTQYVENETLASSYKTGNYPVTFVVSIYDEGTKEKKGETKVAGELLIN